VDEWTDAAAALLLLLLLLLGCSDEWTTCSGRMLLTYDG